MRLESTRKRARRARAGFSIVEVLVALVLVTVGLLGIAGNSALAIRVAGSAVRERRAVQRASDRVAIAGSRGCPATGGGALIDARDRLSERWTIDAPINGVAFVDVTVEWSAPAGIRSVLLRDAIVC